MTDARLRIATRAIVLDDTDRVLLVRFGFGDRAVWVTPGGGVEENETDEQSIRRELLEEAGLAGFELGPHVWTRTALEPLGGGRWDGEVERIFLVRTPAFDPTPSLGWDGLQAEGVTAVRWWSLEELEAAQTRFAPRRLPILLRELILHGPPSAPVDVDP
jgi:8-oxo-dGTP pyrophosphatase MutT (NUDIX family)